MGKSFIEKTPSNIDDIIKLSRDKSNYKNRLISVEEFGKYKCRQSIDKLWRLMISDKVFCVQEEAFRKLQNFGENVKLPKKRKGHLVKDINSKLLKVHASLKSDTYTLTDYKIAFKNRYPEAYDIYLYEKKQNFENWILQIIKIAPKKKTRNTYTINITFDCPEENTEYFNGGIKYSIDGLKFDKCSINSSSIKIEAERNTNIQPIDILTNDSSTLHTQITKCLLYYYIHRRKFSKITSITVSRKRDTVFVTVTIPKENIEIEQVVEQNFYINENYILNDIDDIFLMGDKSIALFNGLSYLLKALNTNESSNRFESLWKAFNSIYRYIGKNENENTCLINLRTFMVNNESLFNYSKNIVKNYETSELRKKIQFRNLILNDYPTKNHTVAYIAFLFRNTDKRLLNILLDTLPYREENIKTISSIDKLEGKFNGLNLSHLYNIIKANPDSLLLNEVKKRIEQSIKNNIKSDIEVVIFICVKYAYFIRNKIFHAEKHDLSFKFIKNNLLYEIDWINNVFESLIVELINCNSEWDK
jgi:hypothetical protein